jgi:hypothetical protein
LLVVFVPRTSSTPPTSGCLIGPSSFTDGVEPFCLTLRSQHFERFVSIVLSCCPCLRGPRLSLSSYLVLAFVWLLITCLSSLLVSFLFLSFMNW